MMGALQDTTSICQLLHHKGRKMSEQGVASFYTNDSVDPRWGGATKSGEKFDETLPTVAVPPSRWKELKGKKLKVTNKQTGKSVVVKVNDTGGFEKYGRSLDLSKSAFEAIGNPAKGLVNVEYEVVEE
jgi:rare lipoprotein A